MSEDPAIQDDDDSFTNSIVFKDVLFNGTEPELTFKTSGGGISRSNMLTVTLRTLSEDGYNYLRTAHLQNTTSGDPFAQPVNVYNNIENGFGIFAGYSASIYKRDVPKPVVLSVDPLTGKPGDHIIITGENFITSPESHASVTFTGTDHLIQAQIIEITPGRIEVIVPDMAVTGKVFVMNGRIGVSDSDFVVTH